MIRVPLSVLLLALVTSVAVRADPPSPVTPAEDAVPTPADARELGEGWFRQLQGFDALEAYEARAGGRRAEFVVARRWHEGRAQIVVDVRKPRAFAKIALLFLQNRDRSDDFFIYWPFLRRVRRMTAAKLEGGLLPFGRYVTLADVRPVLPGELDYRRLPDTEVEGEPCYVVEGRPAGRWLGFDSMELALSKRTGVALRTETHRGKEVRRVLVSPKDVRLFEGRYLPMRRRLEVSPSGLTAEVILRNLMIDPPLPDHLFSKQSLLTQRFPSF